MASGHRTGESTFKTWPSPQTNAHKIATSSAIENAVSDIQTILACFSVGGGKFIRSVCNSPTEMAEAGSLSAQRGEGRSEG